MPEKKTGKRASTRKSPSSQAGEYVREEIEHVREGKHGARSAKQAIAIGLSKARRAGVKLPPRPGGKKAVKSTNRKPSAKRSRATLQALQREVRRQHLREPCRATLAAARANGAAPTCVARPSKRCAQKAPPEGVPRRGKPPARGRAGHRRVKSLSTGVKLLQVSA
jgi:hypothetical protein